MKTLCKDVTYKPNNGQNFHSIYKLLIKLRKEYG